MNKIQLLNEIRKILSLPDELRREWSHVLVSLHQESLVWDSLKEFNWDTLDLRKSPESGELSPAAFCLKMLGEPISLSALLSLPLNPLPKQLQRDAMQAYEENLKGPAPVKTLSQAGLLALALRERRRLKDSWGGISSDAVIRSEAAKPVLACLFGMVPDPFEMLQALLHPESGNFQPGLSIHTLLSNPLSEQNQVNLLIALVDRLPLNKTLQFLREVSKQRQWLGAHLSQQLLESGNFENEVWDREDSVEELEAVASQLKTIAHERQLAELHQIAGQSLGAATLLNQALDGAKTLQGYLSGSMARVLYTHRSQEQSGDQTDRLSSWLQAVELAPGQRNLAAGYLKALIDNGRYEEAIEFIGSQLDDGLNDPVIAVVAAKAALNSGKSDVADQLARWALGLVNKGSVLDHEGFIDLYDTFHQLGDLDSAARVAQHGLTYFPTSGELLISSAKAEHDLGRPAASLAQAYLAIAVENTGGSELLDSDSRQLIERVVVGNLEKLGQWQEALQERRRILSDLPVVKKDDLYALAFCALHAGEPDQAVQAGQRILEIDADDGMAHQLMGEAEQMMGNYDIAMKHILISKDRLPHQPQPWLALASIYKQEGQATKALEILSEASQSVPDSADIHLALGEAFLEGNAPTQALACFKRAAELSSSQRISLRLGQTLFQMGYIEDAKRVLEDAYAVLSPEYDERIKDRNNGFDLVQSGVSSSAAAGFDINHELIISYAQTLVAVGDHSKAIPLYEKLLQTYPQNNRIRLELARAAYNAGKHQLVIPLLEQLVENETYNLDEDQASQVDLDEIKLQAKVLLAGAYAQVGDLNRSLDIYRQLLDSNQLYDTKERVDICLGLGQVALELGHPGTAVAALLDAALIDPQNLMIQQSLSDAYLASGLLEEAFQTAQAALNLNHSDIEVLIWFIEQGYAINDRKGSARLPLEGELIKALQKAVSLAPQRVDLLVRLGRLLRKCGKNQQAAEIYAKMACVTDDITQVSSQELHQAAQLLYLEGDTQNAVSLYNKAIDQLPEDSSEKMDGISTAMIYSDFAIALQAIGQNEDSLDALDEAIARDPEQKELYVRKAELLVKMRRCQDAAGCWRSALLLDAEDASVIFGLAATLRILGDLVEALTQAEQALIKARETQVIELEKLSRLMAAELAYSLLRPQQAMSYLDDVLLSDGSSKVELSGLWLLAELTIDAANQDSAAEMIDLLRKLDPEHPRSLLCEARLVNLQGYGQVSSDLFDVALSALEKWQPDDQEIWPAAAMQEGVACWRLAAKTAFELALWDEGLSFARELVERAPEEAISHLVLAHGLITRAEASSLLQSLEVMNHLPAESALSEETYQEIEKNLLEAEQNAGELTARLGKPTFGPWGGEPPKIVATCKARALVVFHLSSNSVRLLENQLMSVSPKAESLSALIMGLVRLGEAERAVAITNEPWLQGADGENFTNNPLIMLSLALAYETLDPGKSVEMVGTVLQKVIGPGCCRILSDAALYYLQARLAVASKQNDIAMEGIKQALDVWPEEARWHSLAVDIYLAQDASCGLPDYANALEHLRQAVNYEPHYLPHHMTMGKAYLAMGETSNAIDAYETACELAPDQPEPWMALARAQASFGNLEQAAVCTERAIEKAIEPSEALLLRGEIALQANNARGALSRAQSILRTEPDHPQALHLMGRALEALNRPSEALVALEKAHQLSENSLPIQMEWLQLMRRFKGNEAALDALRELVIRDQEKPELLALLADWLWDASLYDEAIQIARTCLQIEQNTLDDKVQAGLHYLIGLSMRRVGQLDQAIFHLSETIKLRPQHIEALLELGRTYQERREYKQALSIFERAIDVAPQDYRPYFQSGLTLKDGKQYEEAEVMLRRAAKLAPNEVSIHRMLGAVVALNLVHNRHIAQPASGITGV